MPRLSSGVQRHRQRDGFRAGPGRCHESIIIEPWRIPEEGKDFEGEEQPEVIALEKDASAAVEGPITYSLHAQCLGHELLVTGTVGAEVRFTCSRCAESF